ncbi:hypothetical protein [Solibacillus sp. FSL K6-4121]|uniref:hypothetical protein n=1 Tax=Solibacillus sp. FSL K6-4121 TaxID=2921505 RepID=UPI0030F5D5F3
MNKGFVIFVIGIIMFMLGIYLSTSWIVVGSIIGISGGLLLGLSSYFMAMKD